MEQQNDSIFGLLDSGKRIYRKEQQAVSREEFEAQKLFSQLVFGEQGLADTLGPTWQMVNDPRFTAIERAFIRERKAVFGGNATTGLNLELSDGSFYRSVEDLNQYSEILGEGRYFHSVLRSMSYVKAISVLWPHRNWSVPRNEYLPGTYIFNQLSVEEQADVLRLSMTYSEYFPSNLAKQTDSALWGLIKQECPNYFNRAGVVNRVGEDLFAILRLDLVGLIDDYAEVARLQEWVLLDHENTLVEQKHIDTESPRVWAEVELLERALTIRASLRATAAQVIRALGLHHFMDQQDLVLTEQERDDLLQVVYASSYPDNQPELISALLAFLQAIKATGKSTEERTAEQCRAASTQARLYVSKLKSGEVKPITRYTEPGEEERLSDEERLAQDIFHNPLKQMVFIRFTNAEARLTQTEAEVRDVQLRIATPDSWGEDTSYTLHQKLSALKEKLTALEEVCNLLAPVFERADFVLTEDAAADLLARAEEFDSTLLPTAPDPSQVSAAEASQPDVASEAKEG